MSVINCIDRLNLGGQFAFTDLLCSSYTVSVMMDKVRYKSNLNSFVSVRSWTERNRGAKVRLNESVPFIEPDSRNKSWSQMFGMCNLLI